MTEPDDAGAAPATSQLARLRGRAAKARRSAYVDARLDPVGVVVRSAPISLERVNQITKRNRGNAENTNAAIIAEAAVAVLIEDDDTGRLVSIDPDSDTHVDDDGELVGAPVTFASPVLGDILEIDDANGVELVHALYRLAGRSMQIPRDADDVIYFSRGETEKMTRPPGVTGAA